MNAKFLATAALGVVLAASAASAGTIVYAPVINSTNPYTGDLSQVTAGTGDDVTVVFGPTAPTPPNGITVGDDIHLIQRAFGGSNSGQFGASFNDNFLFDLVFPANGPQQAITSQNVTVDIFSKNLEPIGMENVKLSLFVDGDGNGLGGTVGDTLLGSVSTTNSLIDSFSGGFLYSPLEAGVTYILQVTGKLLDTVELGSYRLELTTAPAAVPVPPAVLLLLTGVGALVGYSRIRKNAAA